MQKVIPLVNASVEGKRVLLRTSLNVPLSPSGKVVDMFRLKAAIPTIEWLSQQGARTIVIAHLGEGGASLKGVVETLATLTKTPIRFFGGTLEQTKTEEVKQGECIVLENIRNYEGEKINDPVFSKTLSELADLYVDDAFADAHRAHASIVGVPTFLPSYAGLLMMQEIEHLTPALTPPPHAVAIVGGAKFETKEPLITTLLSQYETLLLGGALANDVLKARGLPIGVSSISNSSIPVSITGNDRVLVPTDGVLVDELHHRHRKGGIHDVRKDEKIIDIGPNTANAWKEIIFHSPFVIWNGPMGVYEQGFIAGTDALAEAIANSHATAVVGGGDTLAALQKFSFDTKKVFLSTGGGAMLQFLSSGTLFGIEALV